MVKSEEIKTKTAKEEQKEKKNILGLNPREEDARAEI